MAGRRAERKEVGGVDGEGSAFGEVGFITKLAKRAKPTKAEG